MAARRGGSQTKAVFIRERAHKKPAEVMAEAKAAGIQLTIGQIYSQRSADKRKARRGDSGKRTKRGRPRTVNAAGAEQQLRAAVAHLGLDRAREIFDDVETTILGR